MLNFANCNRNTRKRCFNSSSKWKIFRQTIKQGSPTLKKNTFEEGIHRSVTFLFFFLFFFLRELSPFSLMNKIIFIWIWKWFSLVGMSVANRCINWLWISLSRVSLLSTYCLNLFRGQQLHPVAEICLAKENWKIMVKVIRNESCTSSVVDNHY